MVDLVSAFKTDNRPNVEEDTSFLATLARKFRDMMDENPKQYKAICISSDTNHTICREYLKDNPSISGDVGNVTSIYGIPVIIDDSVPYGKLVAE